jgi:hypothetical protein
MHQAIQPDDTREDAQGRRHNHLRDLWQDIHAAGHPEAAQVNPHETSQAASGFPTKFEPGGNTNSVIQGY